MDISEIEIGQVLTYDNHYRYKTCYCVPVQTMRTFIRCFFFDFHNGKYLGVESFEVRKAIHPTTINSAYLEEKARKIRHQTIAEALKYKKESYWS